MPRRFVLAALHVLTVPGISILLQALDGLVSTFLLEHSVQLYGLLPFLLPCFCHFRRWQLTVLPRLFKHFVPFTDRVNTRRFIPARWRLLLLTTILLLARARASTWLPIHTLKLLRQSLDVDFLSFRL